ncbi:hypothetical protein GL982_09680 (plasmid) [Spiroplasma citri]|uniref:hypothetical protein n=1 Tax=Spiroplasma citri TaxID=2133 RepID=UPI0013A09898|nr:hypothetical protein [Spiroplasma citri]QIA73828.1 hypothetical protein GL982_09680 [Spiroplasma citri]
MKEFLYYFSKYSAFELVSLSHIEGPWKETKNNEEINNDKMLYYFQEKIKPNWTINLI